MFPNKGSKFPVGKNLKLFNAPWEIKPGFFLTPAAEKTKTQEKNSSQKLKEKTQPLGGFSLQARKLKKKTKISS